MSFEKRIYLSRYKDILATPLSLLITLCFNLLTAWWLIPIILPVADSPSLSEYSQLGEAESLKKLGLGGITLYEKVELKPDILAGVTSQTLTKGYKEIRDI